MTYPEFVASRVKPGADILASLTPTDCHLLHMAIGLSGEAVELLEAKSFENVKEELGDLEFYAEGIRKATGFGRNLTTELRQDCSIQVEIAMICGNIFDTVKKHVIYRKPLNHNLLEHQVRHLNTRLLDYYDIIGVERETILAENMAKLTARYPTAYSDKDAQERKDKANE